MGHLAANRKTGQKIVIHLAEEADPVPVLRCLSAEGIRIKILGVLPHTVRMDIRTPHGVIASKAELLPSRCLDDKSLNRLTLSRRAGEEIVILRGRANTVDEAFQSLLHHCIELEISEIRRNQVRLWIRASPALYIARDELIEYETIGLQYAQSKA
jgi:sRNA-binding carbon storage regulator CsrA